MSWPVRMLICAALLVAGGLVYAARNSPKWSRVTGETMGTRYRVQFMGVKGAGKDVIHHDLKAVLRAINDEMSTWEDASWISRFNAAPAGRPLVTPPHALEVLNCSMEVSKASGGVFAPTSYPLFQRWGFGSAGAILNEAPSKDEIEQLVQLCDYRNLKWDAALGTLEKTLDGVMIDLSALAKGYAVDKLAEILEHHGVRRYLIDIGGEIRAAGQSPKDRPWKVGVEVPEGYQGERLVLPLVDRAVATSGGSRVLKSVGGTVWTHIIDPRSGYPLKKDHPVFSVSVTASDCMLADALATTCFILGPEGSALIVGAFSDCGILFVLADGEVVRLGRFGE